MAYTPPAGNVVYFEQTGAVYSAPSGCAVDFNFEPPVAEVDAALVVTCIISSCHGVVSAASVAIVSASAFALAPAFVQSGIPVTALVYGEALPTGRSSKRVFVSGVVRGYVGGRAFISSSKIVSGSASCKRGSIGACYGCISLLASASAKRGSSGVLSGRVSIPGMVSSSHLTPVTSSVYGVLPLSVSAHGERVRTGSDIEVVFVLSSNQQVEVFNEL